MMILCGRQVVVLAFFWGPTPRFGVCQCTRQKCGKPELGVVSKNKKTCPAAGQAGHTFYVVIWGALHGKS